MSRWEEDADGELCSLLYSMSILRQWFLCQWFVRVLVIRLRSGRSEILRFESVAASCSYYVLGPFNSLRDTRGLVGIFVVWEATSSVRYDLCSVNNDSVLKLCWILLKYFLRFQNITLAPIFTAANYPKPKTSMFLPRMLLSFSALAAQV